MTGVESRYFLRINGHPRYRQFASIIVVCYALTTLIIDLQVKGLVDEYRTTFSDGSPSSWRNWENGPPSETAHICRA